MPAPLGSLSTVAGRSYTTQCHHPDGVLRSSGSNSVTTKLFVPAGAPVHFHGGDIFPRVQQKRFAVYWRKYVTPVAVARAASGNGGDIFPPVQPKRFAVYSSGT